MKAESASAMNDLDQCCEACAACARTCLNGLYRHCLPAGAEHIDQLHVQLMSDCIDICKITADFLTRGSPRHQRVAAVCAEICRACAVSCDALTGMQECAEACRQCESSCRLLAR